MQGTVFNFASLKIVPSYHQEIVSHPMSEHIAAINHVDRSVLSDSESESFSS